MSIKSVNPYNGETIATYTENSDSEVQESIISAQEAFLLWKEKNIAERAAILGRCEAILLKNKEKYARLMANEMGKVLKEGVAEIEKSAAAFKYYAEHAEAFLQDKTVKVEDGECIVAYEPLGVILAIMPWNFPFWQVARFLAPHLIAGNVGILKHASNVSGCALAIEEVLTEAGVPKGVFKSLIISSKKVNTILDHQYVRAATLTGSEGAGSKVAERCGKNIKKSVLELGGSDPFIVLKDADIEAAADTAAKARMLNCGQSCIAAKRFIILASVYDQFLEKFKHHMEQFKLGDPLDESTDYGPMARPDLVDELHEQVAKSAKAGATILLGGKKMKQQGAFYQPTIITDIPEGCPAYEEELFGPVAAIFRAKDETDAIRLANDSRFGLGASLWTKNREKAQQLSRQLASGMVYVNSLVASAPGVPFGGIKFSGYGRELHEAGIKEFTNQKTIWFK